MADYLIQDTTLDAIADAINAKTGGSSAMTPAEMVTAIAAIPSGGITTEYYEYTQAEAWTTDETGNATVFSNTFLNHGDGIYRATVENNPRVRGYEAVRATLIRTPSGYAGTNSHKIGRFERYINTSPQTSPSTDISFFLAAGAVIKVNYYPIFEGGYDYP